MGSPLTLKNSQLVGMRKWHVNDFSNTLIFYIPRHDSISIIRVLHAAQNWWSVLGIQ